MAFKGPVTSLAARYVAPAVIAASVGTIAFYEGVRYKAYSDPVGVLTVCYGETEGVEVSRTYTEAECRRQLEARAAEFAAAVDVLVVPPMSVSTQAALTSFAYNVGMGNFAGSTLLKKLNAGDARGACNEMSRWVYAKGVKLPGLVKRREAERQLCLKGL